MADFLWKLLLCGTVGATVWLFVSCLFDRLKEELAPIRSELDRIEKDNSAGRQSENKRIKEFKERLAEAENLISVLDSRLSMLEDTKEAKAKAASTNAIQELVGRRS